MLDRLDDAFSRQRQFVSDASHELRTPLTAIRGQLEVLARSEQPSTSRGAAGRGHGADRDGEDRTAGRRPAHPRPTRRGGAAATRRDLARALPAAPRRRGRARRRHSRRAAARHSARRSRPADPGDPQPARQRPPPRRADGAGRDLRRGERRAADDPRRRRRPWDLPSGARAGLRPLPPQRGLARPRLRRQRPRPGDRPLDRRVARRPDLGRGLAARRGARIASSWTGSSLSSARRRSARPLPAPSSAPGRWAADRRSLRRFRRCTRRRGRGRR